LILDKSGIVGNSKNKGETAVVFIMFLHVVNTLLQGK
jgi:hypothetical protein